jgi:hypothetical protein
LVKYKKMMGSADQEGVGHKRQNTNRSLPSAECSFPAPTRMLKWGWL